MAYSSTYTTNVNAAIQQSLDNENALLICQAGASPPGSPAAGTLWFDTNDNVLNVYDGSGWVDVTSVIKANADFNLKQLLNARLENSASSLTPGATGVGRAILHTGEKCIQIVKDASTLGRVMVGDASQFIVVSRPLENWKLRATPPTANTIGTSPITDGLLFDAAGEKMTTRLRIPRGFSGAHNAYLRLHCWLEATETAGDDADFQVDWITVEPSSATVLTKTKSNVTAAKDLGSTVAAGSTFVMDIPLAYNDATNPLVAGHHLVAEVYRNGLAEVAGINVFDTEFLFPWGGSNLEA